jgi:hypothetical protein
MFVSRRCRILVATAILAAMTLGIPATALACAVCGTGPDVSGDPTARGFYWGVLFLMAMPFAVAGSIGAWLAYRYWRRYGSPWGQAMAGWLACTREERGR